MKYTGETTGFQSLTRRLLDSSRTNHPECPECGKSIDFAQDLEWMGPTAFLCPYCGKVIEMEQLEVI